MGWGTVVFLVWCLWLCHHDIRWRRLPDMWTVGGAVVLLAVAAVSGEWWPFAGAGLWAVAYLAMALFGAVGGGDVKFASGLGAWLGVVCAHHVVVACVVAVTTAALVSAVIGLISRRDTVPHGPSMVLGCLVAAWLFEPRIPWEAFA